MELLDRFVAEEIQRENKRLEALIDESTAPLREKLISRYGTLTIANPSGGLNTQAHASIIAFRSALLASLQEQIKLEVETRVQSELQTLLNSKAK